MASTDSGGSDVDVDEFRAVCGQLIDLWHSTSQAETRAKDELLARVLYGLAFNVVSSARSAQVLLDAGHTRDAYPLARKCLEFAVAAQWISRKGREGLHAFSYESGRNAANLEADLRGAGIEPPPAIAQELATARILPKIDEAEIFKRFREVCLSFEPGSGLYAIYRLLSAECHPTVSSINMMLNDVGNEDIVRRRRDDQPIVLYVCVLSMLLVLRAADEHTINKPLKSTLRALGRRLRLPGTMLRDRGA